MNTALVEDATFARYRCHFKRQRCRVSTQATSRLAASRDLTNVSMETKEKQRSIVRTNCIPERKKKHTEKASDFQLPPPLHCGGSITLCLLKFQLEYPWRYLQVCQDSGYIAQCDIVSKCRSDGFSKACSSFPRSNLMDSKKGAASVFSDCK